MQSISVFFVGEVHDRQGFWQGLRLACHLEVNIRVAVERSSYSKHFEDWLVAIQVCILLEGIIVYSTHLQRELCCDCMCDFGHSA